MKSSRKDKAAETVPMVSIRGYAASKEGPRPAGYDTDVKPWAETFETTIS
jgi:hypothetical protein